ncbi:DUF4179 domain-containing protein [Fervidibacillus halotolerans]|uniref:DUF4179 domain-containing protein n=1 Tax=Fervidibacillus halotolerans TaxID=2980027 RepID=A0A9E8LZX9_9BACI|nr:DUF4179 domain-containing protein [Fervidibacillus halotolerans]WAA12472.1 DUF4179 domain-containing protein [Fervidibacillus halotolerans]
MKNIEKLLEEKKKRIDSLSAPPELEERLRTALFRKKNNNRSFVIRAGAIAIILILSFATYHYNALAYYGKKLFGFDDVIGDTLQVLNEQGMGQVIDQSVQLADGSLLTISGIMADSNRTILYYKLTNPDGLPSDPFTYFNPSKITGFLTNANKEGSQGSYNEDRTQLVMVADFEPVSPFSKRLTLHYSTTGQEERTLSFSYNPNKAMGKEVKLKIDKTIDIDKGMLTFSSLKATPTMTVVTGTVNMQLDDLNQVHIPFDGIELMVNGEPIEKLGSSSHSSRTGTEFSLRFDALPDSIQTLELDVERFIGYQSVGETIPIHSEEHVFRIGETDVQIVDISVISDRVMVSIQTEKSIILDGVAIVVDGRKIPVENIRQEENLKDGTLMCNQTMIFDSTNLPESLYVDGIYYKKNYHQRIEIPVK